MQEQHNLCVPSYVEDEQSISTVVGHPHILECCSDYLDFMDKQLHFRNKPPLKRMASWDSSAGCALVSQSSGQGLSGHGTEVMAAIGSNEAASFHKLKILKESVGNDQNYETRYLILCRTETPLIQLESDSPGFDKASLSNIPIDPLRLAHRNCGINMLDSLTGVSKKASIALALRNIPGSIFKMASCFARSMF
jgi:prephenate dehydratase